MAGVSNKPLDIPSRRRKKTPPPPSTPNYLVTENGNNIVTEDGNKITYG